MLTAVLIAVLGLAAVLIGCWAILFGDYRDAVAGLIACLIGVIALWVAYLIALGAM